MTKYARKRNDHWIDVYRVPEDFPTLEQLNRSLPGGGFVIVDDELQHGATHNNGDGSAGTYTNPVSPDQLSIPPDEPPLDQNAQRKAMIRGRAAELDKRGKYQEASALRATLGD